jgi:phosphoribosylamine---glycine ligase
MIPSGAAYDVQEGLTGWSCRCTPFLMNVLLIGSGGREHALAYALSKSDKLDKLFCAPGNPGIAEFAKCVPVDWANADDVIAFCEKKDIGFVVVGPEGPLVGGLTDALEQAGIRHFGPSSRAAQLEGSKGFTKDLCRAHNIPTAAYGRFDTAGAAKDYLKGHALPVVVKADGLAAGKGVTIAATRAEAEAAVDACFAGAFGKAGAEVVIEEFLEGEEASFFALCDGTHVLALASAQDHKRVGNGDTGPNTGGMGAYSPAPVMTAALEKQVMREIITPTVAAMATRGAAFKGVLFAGLMITKSGPKLIEYNVRFGDPETQVLMMRLKSDLLDLMLATAKGKLHETKVKWRDDVALTVVMAAKGYPGTPLTGTEIHGVGKAGKMDGVRVFHAGTKLEGETLVADGGRVLSVTARGATVAEAQGRAYEAVAKINWPGGFYRTDIGWLAIKREA